MVTYATGQQAGTIQQTIANIGATVKSIFSRGEGKTVYDTTTGVASYEPGRREIRRIGRVGGVARRGETKRQRAARERAERIAREKEATRLAEIKRQEELAKKRAEEQRLLREQTERQRQASFGARRIGGQVTLVSKTVSPGKHIFQSLVTSGLPARERIKRAFDPTVFVKSPEQRRREFERKAEKEADVLRFGKAEFFGGAEFSNLLPFQQKGTADITKITPFTEEELASTTQFPLGASIVLGERKQKKADIISFSAKQKTLQEIPDFQKQIDVIGKDIQKKIDAGDVSFAEGEKQFETKLQDIQTQADIKFGEKFESIVTPKLEMLETEFGKLEKKQRRTAITTSILKKSPLIAGTLVASTLFPPAAVASASIIGGIGGLAKLGKDTSFVETQIRLRKGSEGNILGFDIVEEKLTPAGTKQLAMSGLLLAGGGFGLFRSGSAAVDRGTLQELQKQKSVILGKEVAKTEKGLVTDIISGKGFKLNVKTGEVIPVGTTQQVTKLRVVLTKTGEKTFTIPSARGETITRFFSERKGKFVTIREQITALGRGQTSQNIFAVSEKGNIISRTQLKGLQSSVGKGILIRGDRLETFKFLGIGKRSGDFTLVKTIAPQKLRVQTNILGEDFGRASIIGKEVRGTGLIQKFEKTDDIFRVFKIPKGTNLLSGDGKSSLFQFQPSRLDSPLFKIPRGTGATQQIVKVDTALSSAPVSLTQEILERTVPQIAPQKVFPLIAPSVKTIPTTPKTQEKTLSQQLIKQTQLEKTKIRTRTKISPMVSETVKEAQKIRQSFLQPQALKTFQSQNIVQSLSQPQILKQEQLLKTKMQLPQFFSSQISLTSRAGFRFGGFLLPSLPKGGIPLGRKKTKTQLFPQPTRYQPSFTGSILDIRIDVPEHYEKYGFGAIKIRGRRKTKKAKKK